jgi:probable F420-dependent oxidoreductase
MKFVVSLAFSPAGHLVPLARACEAAGFEAVAMSDHLVHPEKIRAPYPYTGDGTPRWEPFTPWPDPWVSIGAMAAITERLRFLTSVYVLPLRSPFLVAKAVATAAALSDGRVVLGAGAGWMRDEFELLGAGFGDRGRRMDEMIDVLRALWAGGFVEHHGRFYDFPPLEMSPAPTRDVPIWVGGISAPALRRAATLGDGWISDLHTTGELEAYVAKLRALRAGSERAGRPFAVAASCSDAFDLAGYRRLAEVGVTHLVTMPWLFHGGPTDDLARKCDGVRRFADAVLAPLGEEAE